MNFIVRSILNEYNQTYGGNDLIRLWGQSGYMEKVSRGKK